MGGVLCASSSCYSMPDVHIRITRDTHVSNKPVNDLTSFKGWEKIPIEGYEVYKIKFCESCYSKHQNEVLGLTKYGISYNVSM